MKKKIKIIIATIMFFMFLIPNLQVIAFNKVTNNQIRVYTIDLIKFGIKNDGSMPIETSKGINEALQFVRKEGYQKVIFPKGIYLISENTPIALDMQDIEIDLNGSTLQINTNGLDKYSIITFKETAKNLRLTNGSVRGDKDTHDYKTIKSTHEWACGVTFEGGENLQMDNVTVSNVPGYAIFTQSGVANGKFKEISTKNLEVGNINNLGAFVESKDSIRTKTPYNISELSGKFEVGYTLGYQGYPVLKNKEYVSYFYDKNMNFISKMDCIQFRKVDIPENAVYVNFLFSQKDLPTNPTSAAWISNLKPPINVKLNNCIIKENRTLGLAFCGGQKWIIENNLFEKNGGNAPGYAIDFEDGWELMQDVVVKNNKFTGNSGDIVSCAGDNFVFEGNEFSSIVYMWGRTTNYKFLNNKFLGKNEIVKYEYTTDIVSNGNYYKGARLIASRKGDVGKIKIENELFENSNISIMPSDQYLMNSTIINDGSETILLEGTFKNCNLKVKKTHLVTVGTTKLYDCVIENSDITAQRLSILENCTLKNSTISSTTNTERLNINKSNFQNSNIRVNTWGSPSEVIVENSDINMTNGPFVYISAGKMKNLILRNNNINNLSQVQLLNMFDTNYSEPNANIFLENNKITQPNYKYIFDGRYINRGIVNFTQKNNILNGAEMLNPKYINNQYFKIIN